MKSRKLCVLVLALAMVLSPAANSFAASGAADSDSTDYNTDRTGNSTADRQANSSDTGTIRLGKILTVNQSGKFPNTEDFVYRITPVNAWENNNEEAAKSGAEISPEDMPKPDASTVSHHGIVNTTETGGTRASWYSMVDIGNFKDKTEANTSSIYGDKDHRYENSDDASNTTKTDENRRRTRVTDVSFKFTKAGYYMYRIEEEGSRSGGSTGDVRRDVPGVDYDENTYYVVFYVCNREASEDDGANEYGQGTQKGDTVDGVYVHTITSWTNQPADTEAGREATDYKPDNSMRTSDDIADADNWLHDLMQSQDVDSSYNTDYGDGGHPAALNTGGSSENTGGRSSVTHDNLGKVGISTPDNPNYLEAYRMWNSHITHDVVLRKNVTGNLGDKSKEFVFEVELSGLEGNQTYTTDVPAGAADEAADAGAATNDTTSAGVRMYDMSPSSCLSEDGKSFTADSSGAVTFKVKLKDDDVFVLNSLPMSASYKVTEQASDHVPQYNIVSTNKSADKLPVFAETGYTPGGTDAAHLGKANANANTTLATETEFVDRYDGTVTIIYRNNRDLATVTGVAGLDYMVYAAVFAVLSAVMLIIVRRRREYAAEERALV